MNAGKAMPVSDLFKQSQTLLEMLDGLLRVTLPASRNYISIVAVNSLVIDPTR